MNLCIRNLTKEYEKVPVLQDISIHLQSVKSLGIIGESGCGKSTLLRQLAGIEEPNKGEIFINQLSPMLQKREFQDNIAYVFQKHNLFPHLTVQKNISLILEKIKGFSKEEANKRTSEVLSLLRIEKEAHKKPHQISGGQAQRASIARALSANPELIFLDEPTAALDPLLTEEVLSSVTELKNSGIEFIFVTHEIEFLKDFADYVIFMDHGNIVEHGDISCLSYPKTDQLRNFLRLDICQNLHVVI